MADVDASIRATVLVPAFATQTESGPIARARGYAPASRLMVAATSPDPPSRRWIESDRSSAAQAEPPPNLIWRASTPLIVLLTTPVAVSISVIVWPKASALQAWPLPTARPVGWPTRPICWLEALARSVGSELTTPASSEPTHSRSASAAIVTGPAGTWRTSTTEPVPASSVTTVSGPGGIAAAAGSRPARATNAAKPTTATSG